MTDLSPTMGYPNYPAVIRAKKRAAEAVALGQAVAAGHAQILLVALDLCERTVDEYAGVILKLTDAIGRLDPGLSVDEFRAKYLGLSGGAEAVRQAAGQEVERAAGGVSSPCPGGSALDGLAADHTARAPQPRLPSHHPSVGAAQAVRPRARKNPDAMGADTPASGSPNKES